MYSKSLDHYLEYLNKIKMYRSNIKFGSVEGAKIWKSMRVIERDKNLSMLVKENNKQNNKGRLVCESCGFSDILNSMLDAHHINPIASGVRQSTVADIIVLCPTCHRWAHQKAENRLYPLSLKAIKLERAKSN